MLTEPNNSHVFGDIMDLYDDLLDYYNALNASGAANDNFVPNPDTFACEPFAPEPWLGLAICICFTALFLLAAPGNLLVCTVLSFGTHTLLPSDLYLLHLAAADTLLSITLPFWGWAALRGWVFGDIACKLLSLALELSFYSSILLLACISADRYRLVVRPTQSRKEARGKRDWLACATVWTLGAMLSLPALLRVAERPAGSDRVVCVDSYSADSAAAWRLATRVVRHTLGFLLPLAIMLLCYRAAAVRLRRVRSPRGRRARRLIVAVVVVFLLCWTPHHVAVMADTLQRAWLIPHGCAAHWIVGGAQFATQCLGLLHSLTNPVLYAFMGHKFREDLRRRFSKIGLRESVEGPRNSRSASQTSSGL